jgi:hypothetical protein
MNSAVPVHEIYRTHMLEFKLRLQRTEQVATSKSPVTGLAALDAELCFLQIRRMVELITFSAAVRDEERYRKLRELQKRENNRDHGDYTRDWEAPDILKRLSEISLHFLPIPIKQIKRSQTATTRIDRKSLPVTHGRLIEIYKTAGGFLHGRNPLGKDFAKLVDSERKKYEQANAEIQKTLKFLRGLMWHHAAIGLEWCANLDPRDLANPQTAWLIDFGEESTIDIKIVLAEAQ